MGFPGSKSTPVVLGGGFRIANADNLPLALLGIILGFLSTAIAVAALVVGIIAIVKAQHNQTLQLHYAQARLQQL
eukprot:CAMPEP_0173442536 /NCGR_PEP_ID=MMETSP1357-20121228/27308_1 /TAXON_ID=77926 /ORGANISM="Hemiselmis rufescens, Strain PCC563" /LENGTH=74 /DNA_ID=CAMNT_0014408307 /DNA_START=38 /DNA_END=258 /DNA_ORIENTATION=+